MQLLVAILLAFLPVERRHRWERLRYPLEAGTAIGALAQILGGVLLTAHFYPRYHAHYMQNFLGGENAVGFVFGATLWVGFLFFSAWGLLAIYLFTEGIIRGLTVAVTHEPCGSLVVFLADLARLHRPRKRQPPPPPDALTRDADAVVIATSRPRDWDELTTLEIDGEHYVIAAHAADGARHTYRLAPMPPGRVIRKLVRYPD